MMLNKQRGVALLVLSLLMLLLMSTWLMAHHGMSGQNRNVNKINKVSARLKQAKQALLVYAITAHQSYGEHEKPSVANAKYQRVRLGELPCPDINMDGYSDVRDRVAEKCKFLVGWLPWRTLKIPPPKMGERLWYAVDEAFYNRSGNKSEPLLNPSVQPQALTLDSNPMVAVVIAENQTLNGQLLVRTGFSDQDMPHALESVSVSGSRVRVISKPVSEHYNDTLLGLTQEEVMSLVAQRAILKLYDWLVHVEGPRLRFFPPSAIVLEGKCRAFESVLFQGTWGFLPKTCKVKQALSGKPLEEFRRETGLSKKQAASWVFRNEWYRFFHYRIRRSNLLGYQVQLKPIGNALWTKNVAPVQTNGWLMRNAPNVRNVP